MLGAYENEGLMDYLFVGLKEERPFVKWLEIDKQRKFRRDERDS